MYYQTLTNRTLISLSGDDTLTFLQGIITQDANKLASGEALYAALLSPQGKFLHDFSLIPREGKIWLDVDKNRAPDLLAKLKGYKLRSKVVMEPLPESIGVVAFWDGKGDGTIDPRIPALGQRLYGDLNASLMYAKTAAQEGDYEAHRIALGVPDGAIDMTPEKSLLLEFGFEDLHGVSFTKGCYVGQEVTARTKYRGQVRRHLCKITASETLSNKGAIIISNEQTVGELLSVSDKNALALLRVEAMGNAMKCGDISVIATWPEWLVHTPQKDE